MKCCLLSLSLLLCAPGSLLTQDNSPVELTEQVDSFCAIKILFTTDDEQSVWKTISDMSADLVRRHDESDTKEKNTESFRAGLQETAQTLKQMFDLVTTEESVRVQITTYTDERSLVENEKGIEFIIMFAPDADSQQKVTQLLSKVDVNNVAVTIDVLPALLDETFMTLSGTCRIVIHGYDLQDEQI